MFDGKIALEGLPGVERLELDLEVGNRAYVFIGTNGVGKTQCLEALFQLWFFANEQVVAAASESKLGAFDKKVLRFSKVETNELLTAVRWINNSNNFVSAREVVSLLPTNIHHSRPVVFLGAGSRSLMNQSGSSHEKLDVFASRKVKYLAQIVQDMSNSFSSLNMQVDLQSWITTRAKYSNRFVKGVDSREIEIKTLLQILHKIDDRIDADFLEMDGSDNVYIKISGKELQLSQLSSGFAALVRIIQAIIAGFGNFTNAENLAEVEGVVLIDEIESHLHVQWQTRIISLLKQAFPKTIFYCSTHSPIVISQLNMTEAYVLQLDDDGVVRSKEIAHPSNGLLTDMIKSEFDFDVERAKVEHDDPKRRERMRRSLGELLDILEHG